MMKYIGVDLGGTNIVVGLIDIDGNIIKSYTRPTLSTRKTEEIFDDIIDMCQILIEEFKLDKSSLKGIGMGIPGEVDSKNGIINYSNNIPIKNFNVKSYMQNLCKKVNMNIPFFFANDADCAALGELVAGAGKGYSDLIILTLGTGVGGGIIINNKIYSGFYAGGAELGHQTIVHNGELCTCGNKGCLEAYASATALIRDAKNAAKQTPSSLLNSLTENNLENMTAKIVFDAKNQNDDVAIKLVDDYIEYLSVGVANLINIFKPQVILLSGGISKQGEKLIIPLKEKVMSKVFGKDLKTKIDIATLGNNAGLIGAAMLSK
ncbi:ROK family protein [[Clostridium] colinum]|uniref:ROK family protein n=1 Tax=[Clostridium] colinum TaxID=36835 RepID=UPI0020246254|nr:ROK family protein [[Clostridium] colinum]